MENLILNTDSYKCSQWLQYPPKTEKVFSYVEARGGQYPKTVFLGLQPYLMEYLSKPITQEMIEEAAVFLKAHGEPFNREGWEYILKEHNGYLPIKIRAVREGTVVPVSNVMVTVENTDPKCFWLTSYIETSLLRSIWYPTTVCTNSWSIKQVIKRYLKETADPEAMAGLDFKLIDFGARGVSSFESAGLGGMAHMPNFMGSDNIVGALFAMKYYGGDMPAFSVPASEHSTMTSWGKDRELDAYRNMLVQFKGYPIISIVPDSYDIFHAVENIIGDELKDMIVSGEATVVIRPDSGDPATIVTQIAKLLDKRFGSMVNTKGYKELKHVKILQGDGINEKSIDSILRRLTSEGFSADNMVFGQGGGLLQQLDRDTCKFAMKASAAKIDGEWIDVFKDPITDKGKRSKKGRISLYQDADGNFRTATEVPDIGFKDVMHTVFENGKILKTWTFEEVREQVEKTTV